MALRLMHFSFTIRHRPGKDNIACFLSRHPVQTTVINENEEVVSYVAFITEYASPIAISHEILVIETNLNERLKILKKLMLEEVEENGELARSVEIKFRQVWNELTITKEGLVLRDTCLIIPQKLQAQVLNIAHEGHQGISKAKSLLRTFESGSVASTKKSKS